VTLDGSCGGAGEGLHDRAHHAAGAGDAGLCVKLTKDAIKCWKDDIEGLRAVGFDDRGILQITLIASWFNYINRWRMRWGGRE